MRVLVTGGAGFVGSHIVDKLIELGSEVVIVDNFVTGKSTHINPKAKFFNIDICSPDLELAFQEPIDYVIHQAAQVDVAKSIKDPLYDAKVNIIGSLNLLKLCKKYNVKKIVYGNSGAAPIGEPESVPIGENHPKRPLTPYGLSKHTVHEYLKIYSKLYGIKFTSLGYANVYGPRQDPFGEGGVVAIFSHALLTNKSPIIFGDGNQTRDFVYVGDVADANIMALTRGDNEYFNVSSGEEISVNQLVSKLTQILSSTIIPVNNPPREGDIYRSVLDPKKINTTLGWRAATSLQEGLQKTVNAFKEERK